MNTPTYPAKSLYVRLHGSAPAGATSIPIPRDIAAAWAPQSGPDERHDRRVQFGAAAIVLIGAIVAAAIVLA